MELGLDLWLYRHQDRKQEHKWHCHSALGQLNLSSFRFQSKSQSKDHLFVMGREGGGVIRNMIYKSCNIGGKRHVQ